MEFKQVPIVFPFNNFFMIDFRGSIHKFPPTPLNGLRQNVNNDKMKKKKKKMLRDITFEAFLRFP